MRYLFALLLFLFLAWMLLYGPRIRRPRPVIAYRRLFLARHTLARRIRLAVEALMGRD
jgi:hypothetical protein